MNRDQGKINNSQDQQIQKIAGFVRKLFNILNTPIYSKVICWSEDGKSLRILNCKQLESKVLQSNFRHRNFHSFIRQLNMYGFRKMERTVINKICSFSHPLFERDGQNNLHLIKTKHQAKKIQREERQFSINSVEKKNLVEKLQRKLRFKTFNSQTFKKDNTDEIMGYDNLFGSLPSQKQNSTRFSTKQLYQQRRSVQKLTPQKFQNYCQQQTIIDRNCVFKNVSFQTATKSDSLSEMNKVQMNSQRENIFFNQNLQKDYKNISDANQYLFYETALNMNASDLSQSPIQNLTKQKQSFVELLPNTKNFSNPSGITLTPSIPSFNIPQYNIQVQPIYYPQMVSAQNYIPISTSSYPQYFPIMQQMPSLPQLCVPQMCYNSFI